MSTEKLVEIEVRYKTESITINDQSVWPVLRLKINEFIRSKNELVSRSFRLKDNVNYNSFRNLFFGIKYLLKFKKYEQWFFSSSERRKNIDGIYEDRVIEGIIKKDNVLCIENPYPLGKHYSAKDLAKIDIISQSLFYIGEIMFSILFGNNFTIYNESVLKSILKENDLDFNYKTYIKRYLGQYLFYKTVLRYHRPKVVFLVYSASSMGMIKALKEKNIPVVELQHGIINEEHLAYNVYKDFGKTLFPDYLLIYGETELRLFNKNNFFINSNNVIPVGYYFLERSKEVKEPENKYSKYKKIVVFSFQEVFEEPIFNFLNSVANLDSSICYLIIPRDTNKNYEEIKLEPNIFIEKTINIYDALKICDIHSTINSTCAIEGLTFGVPNILYNYNDWASGYFESILGNDNCTFYVKTPSEFIEVVRKNDFMSHKEIMKKGNTFFKTDFLDNFNKILNQRILKKQQIEN